MQRDRQPIGRMKAAANFPHILHLSLELFSWYRSALLLSWDENYSHLHGATPQWFTAIMSHSPFVTFEFQPRQLIQLPPVIKYRNSFRRGRGHPVCSSIFLTPNLHILPVINPYWYVYVYIFEIYIYIFEKYTKLYIFLFFLLNLFFRINFFYALAAV